MTENEATRTHLKRTLPSTLSTYNLENVKCGRRRVSSVHVTYELCHLSLQTIHSLAVEIFSRSPPANILRIFVAENFSNPIVDMWTSNVFVIMNSEIKFCDEKIRVCSRFLQTKHAKNPLMFTIAQKHRRVRMVGYLTQT